MANRGAAAREPGVNGSRGIQSITIGCRILRALEGAPGALPLKDVAAAAEMPPSKVRFYIVSFLREGLVVQDRVTGHYSLGPFAIQLGLSALRKSDLVELSREPMTELCEKTKLSVFLTIWGNRGPTIVSKFEGQEQSPLGIRVGFALPMTISATGQIFYTFMPARETDSILKLEQSGLLGNGVRSVPPATLAKIKKQILAEGFAQSNSQIYEGFTGASAPIFDSGKTLAGAITILGTSTLFGSETRARKVTELLREAAQLISMQIGYRSSLASH